MAPPSWVEVIYVIPLYGVSRGLNLNLSSVGGRSLKLTDYYRAEARCYLPDRAKTEAETMRQSRGRGSKVETEARPCEAEARPSQLKKLSRGRLEPRQMPRGLHPWKRIKPVLETRVCGYSKWHRRVAGLCSVLEVGRQEGHMTKTSRISNSQTVFLGRHSEYQA